MLDMIADYHLMQFQRKRTIQTQENVKKSLFRSDLGPLRPNLGRQSFFFKNVALSVTRYHDKHHHVRTDGRTGRRTDGRTRVIS